jgi:hypothetical protein
MKSRRISLALVVTAVVGLSSLYWLVPLSRTGQAAPAPPSDAAFKGKVLLVSTNHMMMAGFLLEKAQVQKIGEHSFLVGRGAADGRVTGWYKGRIVRLQMEHIVSVTEFDDLKEAKKALESGGGMPFGVQAISSEATPPVPAVAPALPADSAPVPPPPPAKRP